MKSAVMRLIKLFVMSASWLLIVAPCANAAVPSLIVEPQKPASYAPFNVRVTFASEVCFGVTSPIYSSVSFKNGVLSLSLSHLKSGPCVTERVLPISGLPPGTHTIRVSVTSTKLPATGYGFSTNDTEIASTVVTVVAPVQLEVVNLFTARVDGDNIFRPFPYTEGGGGPVVLWIPQGGALTGLPFGCNRASRR